MIEDGRVSPTSGPSAEPFPAAGDRFRLRHLGAAALLVACGAFWACRDVTGPGLEVVVSIEHVDGAELTTDDAGQPVLTCGARLSARATGPGSATWMDADFLFFAGADRSTPLDSSVIPATTIRTSWGKEAIAAGVQQASGWRLSAHAPFGVRFVYHYQTDKGSLRTTAVSFSCGPVAAPGHAPPDITTFARHTTGPVQPGDTLRLDVTATSGAGLLETVVHVSGACTASLTLNDSLFPYLTRTLGIVLPNACPLGAQLVVSVAVVDAELQATTRTLTLPPLVDVKPPAVSAYLALRYNGLWQDARLGGNWFVGDTLHLVISATDNVQLKTLLWEMQPAGIRDSVAVSGRSGLATIPIPARPEFAGTHRVLVSARDTNGNTSVPIASDSGGVNIFPTASPATVVASVAGAINGIAFDTLRDVVYLLQTDSSRIAIFSPATMSVTGTIPLPGRPVGLDLSVSGDSLVTLLGPSGALGIVDLRATPFAVSVVPVTRPDTTTPAGPVTVRVAANGLALVTTDYGDHLITVDLATGAQRLRLDVGAAGQTGFGFIERSGDRSAVFLSGAGVLQRYDAASDKWGPTTPMEPGAWPVVDRHGDHIALGYALYDASLRLLRSVRLWMWQWEPEPALSPDGGTFYLFEPLTGVVRSRVSDGGTIDRFLIPFQATFVRASPDGLRLVAIQSNAAAPSLVTVLDLRQLAGGAAGDPR